MMITDLTSTCNFRTRIPQLKNTHPMMRTERVIQGDHWRIGILTESLIRFEWSESGRFENRCTQVILNRDFPDVDDASIRCSDHDGMLIVDTPALRLTYNRRIFSKEGLQIVIKGLDVFDNVWHFGDNQHANLGGTARTLDGANGAVPLGNGVISRDGWAVLDDSASNAIEPLESDGQSICEDSNGVSGYANVVAKNTSDIDLYFFGYGHRYVQAVHDFYHLTGSAPLLPRFTLGNWWSRFYPYTADEYVHLMDRFKNEGLPFTTAVIDMDWHIRNIDKKYGTGWTGYSWNRDLFPNPQEFLQQLHDRGMHTTLNVHPRDGIRAYEDAYPQVAEAMNVDMVHGDPVEFDLTDPDFVDAYLRMHHDLEQEGVDFWWIDWQQGGVTKQIGLDPLWMLNHLHYTDSGREGHWPLTFSRYAGPGSHRYPVGFSGDTVMTWRSLQFQPYFTSTASNIGYGWWSHDIGGHMLGVRDEELEARWYQFGVFSPINRLHSSSSPFNSKEPWNFHEPVRSVMMDMLRLRHALIPYIYTMNWRNSLQGRPLIEPMYWIYPEQDKAYVVPNEYYFGSQLVVAPITEPLDKESLRGKTVVWLPQGRWFDFFTGRTYISQADEGTRFQTWRTIDSVPVFAKAGAVVPLQADNTHNSIDNPKRIHILVFPGEDGNFTLREDDGSYCANGNLEDMHVADTRMNMEWSQGRFTIHACGESTDIVPKNREWKVSFRGVEPARACLNNQLCEQVEYDERTMSLTVGVPSTPVTADIVISFPEGLKIAANPVDKDVFDICMDAQISQSLKEEAYNLIRESGVNALPALRVIKYTYTDSEGEHHDYIPQSVISALEEVLLRA